MRILLVAAAVLLRVVPALAPPVQPDFVPLRADGNDIPALARTVTVGVPSQRLGDALRTVARLAGVDFSAAGDLAALDQPVRLDTAARRVSVVLLRLVQGTGVELLVSPAGPTIVARPSAIRAAPQRTARGVVRDSATGDAIAGAVVELRRAGTPTPARVVTGDDGTYALPLPPDGAVRLHVRRLGYRPRDVEGGDERALTVRLARVELSLSTVVVTPGYYGVMEQRVTAPQTLTREQIRAMPQIGEDLFRSVSRLPGVSASDFSAAFRVRSGANRELYATLDGLELVEPFHLKDFDSAISIIDVGAIAGLDLTTGGFGARYGNRLTGVLAMRTVDPEPASAARTELALTLTTARATSRGTFAGDRGGWLVSARRGFLEYALRAAGEDDNLRPRYYDVLAKGTYRLGGRATLSLHALRAGDRLTYQDDPDDPRVESRYGSGYVWAVLGASPARGLGTETVVSYGALDWWRAGTHTSSFDGARDVTIRDDRSFHVAAVRQDWQWEPSRAALVSWGAELKTLGAAYDYARDERRLTAVQGRPVPTPFSLRASAAPTGTTFGGYATLKVRPVARLTAEVGLRADRQTYTDERQVSPRAAAALDLGARTTARAAWGRYAQPEGLFELQTADGVTRFDRAERAEHRVVGVDHRFGRGLVARVEAYERRLRRVQPRYVSVDNSVEVFPEITPERALFAPTSGRARGMELLASRSPAHRVTWSASYAFAVATDVVTADVVASDVVASDVVASDVAGGRSVPRTLDQRHTVALDAGWRPSRAWQVNAAWLYHTGWPTTSFDFAVDTLADGRLLGRRVYGPRNAERLAPYHRLDFRATRTFTPGASRVALFVDLFNAYARRNPRAYDAVVTGDGRTVTFGKRVDALVPRLPSFGVSWEF